MNKIDAAARLDRLEDWRNILMHSYGEGAFHDGLVARAIRETGNEIAAFRAALGTGDGS